MIATSAASFAIGLTLAGPLTTPVQLRLILTGGPTAIGSAAVAEAARVWAPYGVSIHAAAVTAGDGAVVRVAIADRAMAPAADPRALGSVAFHGGVPDPEIILYQGRAWELIAAAVGSAVDHWPTTYREVVLGRVLGRALAHELGHYLLHTPGHSTDGLMRATQQIVDLMTTDKRKLFLPPEDLAALPAAIDRLRRQESSAIGPASHGKG
jgi:hypothetical protein